MRDICREILRLYKRVKPDHDKLEQAVSVLKKAQLEAKARLRSNLGNNTPNTNSGSRPATPSKVSPYSSFEDQRQRGDNLINGWVIVDHLFSEINFFQMDLCNVHSIPSFHKLC